MQLATSVVAAEDRSAVPKASCEVPNAGSRAEETEVGITAIRHEVAVTPFSHRDAANAKRAAEEAETEAMKAAAQAEDGENAGCRS